MRVSVALSRDEQFRRCVVLDVANPEPVEGRDRREHEQWWRRRRLVPIGLALRPRRRLFDLHLDEPSGGFMDDDAVRWLAGLPQC